MGSYGVRRDKEGNVTVLKEPPARTSSDPKRSAGDAAERQMAFYLRRAFGKSADIYVINDLRLVEGGDAAQIDHLVIHGGGAIIIESKSVTQKVSVNSRGEWARLWDGHWKGMPSPIMQARQQARFLKDYIQRHRKVIRGTMGSLVFRGLSEFDIGVVVAVSNDGIIKRDHATSAPEAMKADQVVFAVEEMIERQRRAAGLSKFFPKWEETVKALRPQELEQLLEVLLKGNTLRHGEPPVGVGAAKRDPWGFDLQQSEPRLDLSAFGTDQGISEEKDGLAQPEDGSRHAAAPRCKHCGDSSLQILHGRFGYYWKCLACEGNTVIEKVAPDGRQGKKLRKQGLEFFLVFDDGAEILFHTNAEADTEATT